MPLCDTVYVFENTTFVHCKSILGLHEMFPSLVIEEIKCYERGGGGGGGGILPWDIVR